MAILTDFKIASLPYQISQSQLINWLALAHSYSKNPINTKENEFYYEIKEKLLKIGLGENKIQFRSFVLDDPLKRQWKEMKIYNLLENANGQSLSERMNFFEKQVDNIVSQLYLNVSLPDHLIQVTCTGYISPSAIQKLVSQKKSSCYTTHAYHMGCYGALAALRIANSYHPFSVDIVHTEICSIHMQPNQHSLGQLVAETLFADGFIKYSLRKKGKGFRILSIHEKIIPSTEDAMDWRLGSFGMKIFLAKEIPFYLKNHLPCFLEELLKISGKKMQDLASFYFAIHPGGPKIIEGVSKLFHLQEDQIYHSHQILKNHGNMSSATLPHIWESLLNDSNIKEGSFIISLAFGPGLTIFGAILEKGDY